MYSKTVFTQRYELLNKNFQRTKKITQYDLIFFFLSPNKY